MIVIISIIALIAASTAEPPVGDGFAGYPVGPHQHHDHGTHGLSQQYESGVHRTIPSEEYGVQFQRSGNLEENGSSFQRSGPSQEYGVPSQRSDFSNGYDQTSQNTGLSQGYGVPSLRSGLSQEYGLPSLQLGLSKHNTASQRPSPHEYETPAQRYTRPSQEYGAPSSTHSGFGKSGLLPRLTQDYGVPSQRSHFGHGKTFQSNYPTPSYNSVSTRSSSGQYGTPNLKDTGVKFGDSYSKSFEGNGISQGYGAPYQHSGLSEQYGTPNTRSASLRNGAARGTISQQYGAPKNSITSKYGKHKGLSNTSPSHRYETPNTRTRLSQSYSAPGGLARNFGGAMPSEQYGLPRQYNDQKNQGYDYARNAEDGIQNQEPASYQFGYQVNDEESGSDFGHRETRDDKHAEGSYFVLLPDGSKQVVDYEADERGFKPRISVEPAAGGRSGYGGGYGGGAGPAAGSGVPEEASLAAGAARGGGPY